MKYDAHLSHVLNQDIYYDQHNVFVKVDTNYFMIGTIKTRVTELRLSMAGYIK